MKTAAQGLRRVIKQIYEKYSEICTEKTQFLLKIELFNILYRPGTDDPLVWPPDHPFGDNYLLIGCWQWKQWSSGDKGWMTWRIVTVVVTWPEHPSRDLVWWGDHLTLARWPGHRHLLGQTVIRTDNCWQGHNGSVYTVYRVVCIVSTSSVSSPGLHRTNLLCSRELTENLLLNKHSPFPQRSLDLSRARSS